MAVSVSYRNDLWIRVSVSLLFSLFFLFLGSDSITDILEGKYFWTDLLASFILIFTTTTYIGLLSSWLNAQYGWQSHFATRLIYQLIAGIMLPAAFVLGYMYVYLIVLLDFGRNEVTFFTTEFPISILFIIFWNALYVGFYFYAEQKKAKQDLQLLRKELFTLQHADSGLQMIPTLEEKPEEKEAGENFTDQMPQHSKIRVLIAVSGNKNIPIPVQDIAYIRKNGNFNQLTTFSSQSYLLNHSLEELMTLLDEQFFFRANRQVIINIRACQYFTNEENGKLALELLPPLDEEVLISQKRAPAFKDWLNK